MIHCSRVSRNTSNLSTDFFYLFICDSDYTKPQEDQQKKIIPDFGVLGSRVEKFLPQIRLSDAEIGYNPGSFA